MKYVKTYELFGFGKRKEKNKNPKWQQKFDDAYNFYLKNKNVSVEKIEQIDLPMVWIWDDNSFSIMPALKKHRGSFLFQGGNGKIYNYQVTDDEERGDMIYKNPDSDKGVYEITPEIYEEYLKKAKEINEWLDILDEKRHNSSKKSATISDDGGLNMEMGESELGDLALQEISNALDKELKLKGKEYEFEVSYLKRLSEKEKENIVERLKFRIDDIELKISLKGKIHCKLTTKDPFGVKSQILVTSNSPTEYNDLEKAGPFPSFNDYLMMNDYRPDMDRRRTREYEKEYYKKYPRGSFYKLSPSKWETIEMLQNLTSILKMMDDELSKG